MKSTIKHVVCGISGGVDSAVSAAILKRKGFQVTGLFMKNWDQQNEVDECTGELDREDAHYVCEKLSIPLHEVNFVKEYWNNVFCTLVDGYERGISPNPDVLCNKYVKFGPFVDHATEVLGADAIATGHYARNSAGQFLQHLHPEKEVKLLVSCDRHKDQTLFLSQISNSALRKTMFPVGGINKAEVKKIALELGLDRIVQKKESTGMCFIGVRCFQKFIEQYVESKDGDFIDIETGEVVGHHTGVHKWTIGQRTKLAGLDAAYFVAARCHRTQNIHVAKGTLHPALFHKHFETSTPHWINDPPAGLDTGTATCDFRFQHPHPLEQCFVTRLDDGRLRVTLNEATRGLAPGQHAVFYNGGVCLGSAEIENTQSLYEIENDVRTDSRHQLHYGR